MKENQKSYSEISYLIDKIDFLLRNSERERLMVECRKYKIPSAYAIEIIKYIFPDMRQTAKIPTIVVKWINDEYLLDKRNREKYLSKIPACDLPKYKKFRIGREIKVRYRFKEQTKKYQDNRLARIYCIGLLKYLKNNGY